MTFLIGLVLLILVLAVVLPIVAIVRTNRISELERRVAELEWTLARLAQDKAAAVPKPQKVPVAGVEASAADTVVETHAATAAPPARQETTPPTGPTPDTAPATLEAPLPGVSELRPAAMRSEESLETLIGRKWVGWVAIVLIFGATLFFLKYAFENRWIGELGRVVLGIAAGMAMVAGGYERHQKQWRYLSQVLTSGGVIVLYLSIYAAFGYYHLISQPAAFVFLAIIVAEAYILALVYEAPVVVYLGIAGGFLTPILLSSDRDQYVVLFTYMVILNCGTLVVVLARNWPVIGSLSYIATQLLFWSWYSEHYHPDKRGAVLLFQLVVLALFVFTILVNRRRGRVTKPEEWIRLAAAPFVFYATYYYVLNEDHHDWMAALALLMAVVYAGIAKWDLALEVEDRPLVLVAVGTALTFVTLAIPVQLRSNWITLAWGVEGTVLLWTSWEIKAAGLRGFSGCVLALAVYRFLIVDAPWERSVFTPIVNRYFLGMAALVACLAAATYSSIRSAQRDSAAQRWAWMTGFAAFVVLLVGSSVEAYSYFETQWAAAVGAAVGGSHAEAANHFRWAAQLSLSLLWSGYALALTAAGFRFHQRPLRTAGLVLFGITVGKALFVDIAELEAFYRVVALGALGLVLLGVAWAYQRVLRRERTQ